MHNLKKGAKYTKGRTPVVLSYFESFNTLSQALKKEYQLKKLTKLEKTKIINKYKTLLN